MALITFNSSSISNFDIDATKVTNGATSGDSSSVALQTDSPIDSLVLSVTATGTYAQFRSFLSGIEHSLRPMDVTSIGVSGGATPGSTGTTYKYTMSIRIYWLH
jgi:hypothetical protein